MLPESEPAHAMPFSSVARARTAEWKVRKAGVRGVRDASSHTLEAKGKGVCVWGGGQGWGAGVRDGR